MAVPLALSHIFNYVENRRNIYIKDLQEAVAIKSISELIEHRQDTCRMIQWMANRLSAIGADVKLKDVGYQELSNGKSIPFPKVIFAYVQSSKQYKTVCIYGYVDVFSVSNYNWRTRPFQLTECDGKLYGRGTSDNKGPLLCWLHAIEGFQATGQTLPVNVKFIIEAMGKSSNSHLLTILKQQQHTFLKDIDYLCMSNTYWLGSERPCLTYGFRGYCHFTLEIEGCSKDMTDSSFGGIVYETMSDLIYMLDNLVDNKGNILIPNFDKNIASLKPVDKKLYTKIDLDLYNFCDSIGTMKLPWDNDQVSFLTHLWHYPSLSIHEIESKENETIPNKVKGKFSIRFVPNQTQNEVFGLVTHHLNKKWSERKSCNIMKVSMSSSCKDFLENHSNRNFLAGQRAFQLVYKQTPDFIRDGTSSPAAIILKELTGKDLVILPICSLDSGAHSENEKIYIRNYIDGIKVFAAYLYEVSLIS